MDAACVAPRRLRVTMWEEVGKEHGASARLGVDGDHTVLELEVRGVPLEFIWAYGAGWQIHVEDLGAHLKGHDRSYTPGIADPRFDDLEPRYRAMSVTPLAQVHVSRTIGASAAAIFEVLADPHRHSMFDGSGMVRECALGSSVVDVGDVFVMNMHNDEFGDYDMVNHVVELEVNRRITWAPTRGSHHPEGSSELPSDGPPEITWRYDLESLAPSTTLVTETYDCTYAPGDLRRVLRNGERWRERMVKSLEKLEEVCAGDVGDGRNLR